MKNDFSRFVKWEAFILLAVSCLLPLLADAQPPRYRIIDLGTLGGRNSKAYDINEQGQVVGSAERVRDFWYAFLWENGVMRQISPEVETETAYAINTQGQVAGQMIIRPGGGVGIGRAFFWSNGTIQELGTLGGTFSVAYGVNDSGQVVGQADCCPPFGFDRAFLWENGTMQDLGTLGGQGSAAYGINNLGQVVGNAALANGSLHAFLWQNGIMQDLGVLGGGPYAFSVAYAVNDFRQVVGYSSYREEGGSHAFLWSNGTMRDLGGPPGVVFSYAFDINNLGQVVGGIEMDYTYTVRWAALWDQGLVYNLNGRVINGTDWVLEVAHGINDRGQIVGWGRYRNSRWRAFLLNPLPVGDVDGNGCVNRRDLEAVLRVFGRTGSSLPEDVNKDGKVDDKDPSLVLLHFREGC